MSLVLASASPRRLDLLKQIGITPTCIDPSDIDEVVRKAELPEVYAKRISLEKLSVVAPRHAGNFILAADTVVALGRRILPKVEDKLAAEHCLRLLSGRRHKVIGGIAVASPSGKIVFRAVVSQVIFKRLSDLEIERYLDSGEWQGKAGGYAIQGLAAAFIPHIQGSYSNIVGLSLSDTYALLTGLGFRI